MGTVYKIDSISEYPIITSKSFYLNIWMKSIIFVKKFISLILLKVRLFCKIKYTPDIISFSVIVDKMLLNKLSSFAISSSNIIVANTFFGVCIVFI